MQKAWWLVKVLLGVTGSVAATLGPKLVESFNDHEVRVVLTKAAESFFYTSPKAVSSILRSPVPTYNEADEWEWRKVGDKILHIELRDWMDVLVVAPLTANTLAKMAYGIADNLLTTVWLASANKPVVVAPAMNTQMWEHKAVQQNVNAVHTMGVNVVPPVRKTLACGETGIGAMAPMELVVKYAERAVLDDQMFLRINSKRERQCVR